MAIITHRWSKGPLGAGAVISSTASTQRLESRDCVVIAVGGRKLSRGLGSGQDGQGRRSLRTCSSNRTDETSPSGMRVEPGGNVVRFLDGTLAGAPLGYPTAIRERPRPPGRRKDRV